MFLQQRDYQLLWVGKEGALLHMTHCREKHLSCKMQHTASNKWKTFLHLGIISSLNPNICEFYLLFFFLKAERAAMCAERQQGIHLLRCSCLQSSSGWLWTVLCCWVSVDSFMVSESLSIKITATRKEQLSYRAALSSYLLIGSGQMSPL